MAPRRRSGREASHASPRGRRPSSGPSRSPRRSARRAWHTRLPRPPPPPRSPPGAGQAGEACLERVDVLLQLRCRVPARIDRHEDDRHGRRGEVDRVPEVGKRRRADVRAVGVAEVHDDGLAAQQSQVEWRAVLVGEPKDRGGDGTDRRRRRRDRRRTLGDRVSPRPRCPASSRPCSRRWRTRRPGRGTPSAFASLRYRRTDRGHTGESVGSCRQRRDEPDRRRGSWPRRRHTPLLSLSPMKNDARRPRGREPGR